MEEIRMLRGIVVGTGRSGTTLLVNMLGSHPQLSPLYELEFLTDIINWFRKSDKIEPKNILGLLYGWSWMRGGLPYEDIWDEAYDSKKPRFGSKFALFNRIELMSAATDFLDCLREMPAEQALARFMNTLADLHCRKDGKRDCILKVPALIRAPEVILPPLPDLKLIHIYRDGRDVWCSAKKFWWGPKTVQSCAEWWNENLRIADLIHREFPGRMLDIKYEDLLDRPAEIMREIFEFIEVEPVPVSYEISRKSVSRYRNEMTVEELDRFAQIAGASLEKRGYACP
jgi:hypothetical protein